MKKITTLFVLFITAVIYQSCSPSSFATVGNNGWKVTLYHYSSDVKIQENGQDCKFVEAYAGHQKQSYVAHSSGVGATGGYNDYTNGIQLDKGYETHNITLTKNGKTVTVTISRKSQPYLDVTAALGESNVMSMDALQKEYVKEHKHDKKTR